MPRRTPARPRSPPRPVDLRRAILDASLALLEEGGVAALSMREVARRANVTHGAPYHHFSDRSAILAALAEEGFGLLAQTLAAAMNQEPVGTLARLGAAGRAYVRFAAERTAYMRLMFRPELAPPLLHPTLDVGAACALRVLVTCVTECQTAGTLAPGDPMPIVLTSWSAAHGLAALWIDGPLPRLGLGSSEALAETVGNAIVAWLGAAKGRAKSK